MNQEPGVVDAVVMISGEGSNLQAIIDEAEAGRIGLRSIAVLSNVSGANGLRRARRHGLVTKIVERGDFAERRDFDRALLVAVHELDPDLVILAGFMHVLDDAFVARYAGRLLNIHPSLLPKYRGLRTHEKALAAGDGRHGCSVHFVTAELDGGPVIAQSSVPVLEDDDVGRLSARVQLAEHKLYPEVIGWFASGRLGMVGTEIFLDDQALTAPIDLSIEDEAAYG